MRLGTVSKDGRDIVVAALDPWDAPQERLLDLQSASNGDSIFASMMALINSGNDGLSKARDLVAKADASAIISTTDVDFKAPLPVPEQMRDCLVFETHLLNSFEQARKLTGGEYAIPPIWYEQPIYYKANRFSVIGHGETVRWPHYSEHMDFECELGIVIGKTGVDISAEAAPDHIFGYTIFNDMSSRDAQLKEMPGQLGPAKGKDFDTGNILGPFILTADEVDHPADLDMEAKVNGERWGGGNSGQMHHSFADIIAHISSSETLHAGEVIGSGTVGTGCGLELGKRLADGDEITLTIEKIGTLSNTIKKA